MNINNAITAKADVFKALGHPTRLYIVEKLGEGERCVCNFVEEIDADFSTISKHLSLLKAAGVVEDEKRGKRVYYRLRMPCVLRAAECVEGALRSAAASELARFESK
jgi:ArsR family transcriptional regulator